MPLHLVTRNVTVRPDEGTAVSREPVTATGENFIVNAGGMRVNTGQRTLELFAGVTGVYDHEPP
jgi:LPS export ABC transporter protein LptC